MADDSDSSGLSEHSDKEIQKLAPIFIKAKANAKKAQLLNPPPVVSPPRPKRPPSPPHEEVLGDNPDIAFIVMFRSRFNDALPSKLPNLGPQDIERGVVDSSPSPQVEQLLCSLLALVLNRKKPVERGHHGRALEEAVLSQKSQWPRKWHGANPLHGGKNFENMTPTERLDLLRTLIMWSLSTSEVIQTMIKEKYKQQRHNDDENQPLSVQPWGVDGDKRRYFLVQGLDDTGFRVYREGSRYTKNAHWYNQAGEIDEARALATKLEEVDRSQAARRLAGRIVNAIPTFEANEEKRRKREYRQIQRARFTRPEPGFSLYEGRTRGKRMRYTYDDDDAFLSDATSTRRSARQSARNTPFEAGPTITASGRQSRAPQRGEYGESLLSGPPLSTDELAPEYSEGGGLTSRVQSGSEDSEDPVRSGGRATRSAARPAVNGAANPRKRKHIDTYNDIDDWSGEEDADESGDDWDSDRNASGDEKAPGADDEDDDMSEADDESEAEDLEPHRLVVKLKVPPKVFSTHGTSGALTPVENGGTTPSMLNDSTLPGAPKVEVEGELDSVDSIPESKAEAPQVHQQLSSPTGPSSYPTPISTSFLPSEQKSTVVSAPALPQHGFQSQMMETGMMNGMTQHSILKPDPVESKPQALSQPIVNGSQHASSAGFVTY